MSIMMNKSTRLVVEVHDQKVMLSRMDGWGAASPLTELSRCEWAHKRVEAGTIPFHSPKDVYETEMASMYADWLLLGLEVQS